MEEIGDNKQSFDLRVFLSARVGIPQVHRVLFDVQSNVQRMELLCRLIFDEDDVVSYQALWVCTHFNEDDVTSLIPIQDQMIDVLLVCSHSGKRRLFLSLLFRLPIANPPRVDFLNFCLDHMMSPQETPASQSLCMKLAYNMCRTIPELMQEFCSCLELLEPSLIPLSLRAVKRNAIKAMKSGKALT